eukprot:NODE_989_length_2202_cov_30.073593_g845_i0.p1 GENE.NODE_989_length_2202_cov_30.073593_g845_i0~~NODE_989_length_2202_cov_30.073593_g845_i0.p1  ORF type:complete len:658 (+),score=132.25 NODE_989_length_2202_cov_30.073593_g845_i0:59-2032(+)
MDSIEPGTKEYRTPDNESLTSNCEVKWECFDSIHPFCKCLINWVADLLQRLGLTTSMDQMTLDEEIDSFSTHEDEDSLAHIIVATLDSFYNPELGLASAKISIKGVISDIVNDPDLDQEVLSDLIANAFLHFCTMAGPANRPVPTIQCDDQCDHNDNMDHTVRRSRSRQVRQLYDLDHFSSNDNKKESKSTCRQSRSTERNSPPLIGWSNRKKPPHLSKRRNKPCDTNLICELPSSGSIVRKCVQDEQLIGQLCMGLQSLRENLIEDLKRTARSCWRIYEDVYKRTLLTMLDDLDIISDEGIEDKAAKLWLDINDYCDDLFRTFVDEFKNDVLLDFYERAGTWCQGSANLVCAICLGIDRWEIIRDYMNNKSRVFKSDPFLYVHSNLQSDLSDLLDKLVSPTTTSHAFYVEIDIWYPSLSQDNSTTDKPFPNNTIPKHLQSTNRNEESNKNENYRSCGGHVFVIQRLLQDNYSIISSWRGQYTLQKWISCNPNMLNLSNIEMIKWKNGFQKLLESKVWNNESRELFGELFGIEENNPSLEWEINQNEDCGNIIWEMHYCCEGYHESDCMKNISTILEITAEAKKQTDMLAEGLAISSLRALDDLQTGCLDSKQFGRRCSYFDGFPEDKPTLEDNENQLQEPTQVQLSELVTFEENTN